MKLATTLLLTLATFSTHAADPQQAAVKIDALIEKNYAPNQVEPNPLTEDSIFVRRAYLDIAGRIPTAAEVRGFLGSMDPDKRPELINQLLDSDGRSV